MTFEEARAQFPVLERHAYLNAGTNGPLARPTAAAVTAQLERDLSEGRSGSDWIAPVLALREEARRGFAAVLDVAPALVALTDSTTRGCQVVLAGLGLGPEDEVVTTDQEHFGLMGPLHASGVRVVVAAADEDAILAAVTPRTRLLAVSHVLWTTGRRLDLERLRERSGIPLLVDGAQSGGAIETGAAAYDFYTVSAQKWLCAPDPTGALYVRDPERLAVALPSYLSQQGYESSGAFTPKDGAARFDAGWIGTPTLAGLVAALGTHPDWRYERSAEAAARCRELLDPLVEVVTPPGHSTLVSFRPPGDPTELVASLDGRGVIVRELPGRNLVRASCGWWTNDDDLARLAAGVAAA
ncbi:MAG TPA: aminotransferase class V-fold PLP-dependent enzyme [Gaiellaceae bacterium]|nr:aminotransferase class V-fold PLP-dependent enzyme [Gaiellaceae bacterium]